MVESYGKLPLSFEANQGQAGPQVIFLARGRGYALFLTGDAAVLELKKPSAFSSQLSANRMTPPGLLQRTKDYGPRTDFPIDNRQSSIDNQVVRLRLVGANPKATVTGSDELPGKSNYFLGNDPKKWRTNVPTYSKVRYRDVYPGVDLVYYGNQSGQLEYDFVVAPGADPAAIALEVGAGLVPARGRPEGSPLRIDAAGNLVIAVRGGDVHFNKPTVYQPDSGSSLVTRHSSLVDGRFTLDAENRIQFALGPYDHSKPLVIDPELVYSTYLGGDQDEANAIAVDSSGDAYVTGTTFSTNFPIVNPFQATNKAQNGTAFVTKFNASGSELIYSTYLGGSVSDQGRAIAVDSSGSAYVAGSTCSSDFPTAYPLEASLKGACDGFVTKLNASGTSLVYSTFLGGSGTTGISDEGTGIAVDSAGSAYVTGETWSTDFPTVNPIQGYGGGGDAFLCKFSAAGTALVYSTYLGGSGWDQGAGIAVDTAGNVYVIGSTNSTDFPTVNAFQSAAGEYAEMYGTAFVAKLNAAGSALVYSTYLGGSVSESGNGIAVDSAGNAYLTGATWSSDFPTVNPIEAYQSKYAADNAFVAKLNAAGSALIYSTYLGGSGCLYNPGPGYCGDEGFSIAIDSSGVAYVAGGTASNDFPTVNAIQSSNNDTNDQPDATTGFVACLNAAGSGLAYSTYLGGTWVAYANGLAVDSSGNAYIAGKDGDDFPTVNPFQSSPGGAFVAMISPPPAMTYLPASLNFGTVVGGTTSPEQSVTLAPLTNAAASLSSITASGDFSLVTTTTSCPYTGGQLSGTCTVDVTFSPTATGTRTGAVTITYTGAGSPETVALNGNGVISAADLSPKSLSFSGQDVGSSSAPQAVTLSNPTSLPLNVSNVTVSSGWTQSNSCLPTIAGNASCTITVTFQPTVYGPQTGTLTLTDYASNSPQTVLLSGTALAPVVNLSATSLTFAAQTVSIESSPQTITLTNTGNGALTPLKITRNGNFAETNDCAGSVAAGASCTIKVTFSPAGAGTLTGTLTLTDNASDSPQTVQLSGTGTDFAISSTATSQTVSAGQVANYSVTLAPQDGYSDKVNLTCTGAPSESTCTLTPTSVTLNGSASTTVAVAVSTTAPSHSPPGQRMLPPTLPGLGRMFWLYALLGLASLALAGARKRRAACLLAGCLLIVVLWAACGGGGNHLTTITPPPNQGTPEGTYTVNVTATDATSSALTHTVQLSLTVN